VLMQPKLTPFVIGICNDEVSVEPVKNANIT